MKGLGAVLAGTLRLMQIEFTLEGFTFSLWQVFLFGIIATAVVYLVCKWVSDE